MMTDHIDNASMEFNEPEPIRSFEANRSLVEWFLTHSRIVDTWIRFHVTSKSDGELQTLADQVAELGPLKRDLQTLALILYHIGQGKRFSPIQVNELDILIQGWDPGALVTLGTKLSQQIQVCILSSIISPRLAITQLYTSSRNVGMD